MLDYECSISGLPGESVTDFEEDDDLLDLPVGWSRITIHRREENPKWLMIQQVKQAAIQGLLTQVPEEVRQQQAWVFSLQVEAQFHSLERETPRYLTIEDVAFVSNEGEVVHALDEFRDLLGLDPVDPGEIDEEGVDDTPEEEGSTGEDESE